jgi:hypothetical protein
MRFLDTERSASDRRYQRFLGWLDDTLGDYPATIFDPDEHTLAVRVLYALDHAALLLSDDRQRRLLAVLGQVFSREGGFVPKEIVPAICRLDERDLAWVVSRQVADVVDSAKNEPPEVAAIGWFRNIRFDQHLLELPVTSVFAEVIACREAAYRACAPAAGRARPAVNR